MVFNTFVFASFFCIVYLLYLATMRRLRLQNAMLLAASCLFYGWWDWRFLGLLLLTVVVDFLCAATLDRRRPVGAAERIDGDDPTNAPYRYSRRTRRVILMVSIVANLGILGFFKYFDFFAISFAKMLTTIGLPLEARLLNVILPVGISFYTFQTLSYTIDVYRGRLRAASNFLDLALFVAFFPQLVAGPIVRAVDFLPQVRRPRRLHLPQIYEGCYLILWGLFKKVVIADNLAVLVDRAFAPDAAPLGGTVLVAIYAFAVQIYCDFSGYSDIARGCAKTMGFEFDLNFDLPYFAANPADFWRRWHISLSTWLRDYLYIPLGGNRKGHRRTCINLMLTMLLGGLWHGAAWTFVLWGFYQGALLIGHRLLILQLRDWASSWSAQASAAARYAAILGFFQLTCLGWLIFRADSLDQLGRMSAALCSPWPWWILHGANSVAGTGVWTLAGYTLPLLILQLAQYRAGDLNILLRLPAWARGLSYACMFYGLILAGGQLGKPFIYFQF